jgi:integrase
MSRATAGTPTIRNSNGSLQIVFNPRDGSKKREYLSLGLPDSKQNRIFAELAVKRIQNDILAGHFDGDLSKYKPQTFSKVREIAPVENLSIRDIWDSYTEYKRPQLSQTTIAVDYERVSIYIDRFPTTLFSEAVPIRDWLLNNTTPGQTKRILKGLSACGTWAVKSGIITSNSFDGMAADISTGKGDDELDINPFSIEERELIIQKFWDDGSHYAPLVEFLFRTGCRPSEAIALQWRHITPGHRSIIFDQAVTIGEKGLRVKRGLKTQDRREFPCGEKLKIFLRSIEPSPKDPAQFIFQSPKGKLIDFQNFASRKWKPTIKILGIDKRKSNPYQMRHSYITYCIESGMDAKDVAKLVGNSPEMIYRHYAGAKRDLIAPDF